MSVCTARRANGIPCRAQAITGARVCRVHGGSAPQVIAAARRRLLMLVEPALGVLARAVRLRRSKTWEPSAQELTAVREILTRAGISVVIGEAADNGQVLWEEFIQIHHRAVVLPAADI